MTERTRTLSARVHDGIAYVQISEARRHFATIVDTVLPKYSKVVVEKRGEPVAVISRPDDVETGVVTEEF